MLLLLLLLLLLLSTRLSHLLHNPQSEIGIVLDLQARH
jgi:hypothetical protein